MQMARIVQAVLLMMIVAMAASCASGKEYTSRLFAPRPPAKIDSQAVTIRFIETGTMNADKEGWVTADIIKGKDTVANTIAIEKLSSTISIKKDTLDVNENKTLPVVIPVAKNSSSGEVRKKRTRDMQ
jgi:hypothetical protein